MKYKLLKNDYVDVYGKRLCRIKAVSNFGEVTKGDIGGYIESEANLSQRGDAWVSDNALVYGNAQVYGDARVYGNAQVYGYARVTKYGDCVNITNMRHNITIMPNYIIIGCKTWKSLSDFNLSYKTIGFENGYNDDQCEMIATIVNAIMSKF